MRSRVGDWTAVRTATELLGEIAWYEGGEWGYCPCPGIHLHTTRSRQTDTRVYVAGVPTITCFHSGCAEMIKRANYLLRSRTARFNHFEVPRTTRLKEAHEQIALERKKHESTCLAELAKSALPKIIASSPWSMADMWHDSPTMLFGIEHDWRSVLSLFAQTEVVWIGDLYDSGEPRHHVHFRPVSEWLSLPECPSGPHVSPYVYSRGCFSRKADNVVRRRFLVVESDSLTKEDQGAILRWLRDSARLRLKAVIDTGGKSLHGWFDLPDLNTQREMKSVLVPLGCDPAILNSTQVSRLPSCRRGDNLQRLLYLDDQR